MFLVVQITALSRRISLLDNFDTNAVSKLKKQFKDGILNCMSRV